MRFTLSRSSRKRDQAIKRGKYSHLTLRRATMLPTPMNTLPYHLLARRKDGASEFEAAPARRERLE